MTISLQISKNISIPDPIKIERYFRSPDLGPKLLFFSGGTALRGFSQALIKYTHNSIHLITPFDDGGSSGPLRDAFKMPAVGDFRNRLMALADRNLNGNPEVLDLFTYRLPTNKPSEELVNEIKSMIAGKHSLVVLIQNPLRKIIRNHLKYFLDLMPAKFDLSGANIGNLIIVGGYLNNGRHLDPVLFLFSKLIECRGIVRPVVSSFLHLIAELENGEVIKGQKQLTGKETSLIQSPVKNIYLSKTLDNPQEINLGIREKIVSLILSADLIVYPIGSFYSSLIVTLLPKGVGRNIAKNNCPKIYIPNCKNDPEQFGHSVPDLVKELIRTLQMDLEHDVPISKILNYVLVDTSAHYVSKSDLQEIQEMGIEVLNFTFVRHHDKLIDESLLVNFLLSLT